MMSFGGRDNEFLFAIRATPKQRTERELKVLYSRLRLLNPFQKFSEQSLWDLCKIVRYEFHKEKEVLFSFGKQIPGTKRRDRQCLVLEPSEMLAIDYHDVTIHPSASSIPNRPHALRRASTSDANDRLALDNAVENDTSSSESSSSPQSRSNSLPKSSNGQAILIADNESQSSLSKDLDEDDDDDTDQALDEDSYSLHSSSSFLVKDLVIEVLKKDIENRTSDDIEMLMEFTKSLGAFSNMTESVRKSLCKAMVFAWVEFANTVVLKNEELLDSWSVIINGQVRVKINEEDEGTLLTMGDTFGVEPTMDEQYHKGVMTTMCDDCQFLCIPQAVFCQLVQLGKANIEFISDETGQVVIVKEKRELDNGMKSGHILIRGNTESLMRHMLEESAIDPTYTEDFLLTYRAFTNDPEWICSKLLEWFDNGMFRDKVSRIILLWVNNHFNDFERSGRMMELLEAFEEKLNNSNMSQESKLLNVACTTKAKPRVVSLTRASADELLQFEITGGEAYHSRHQPIYIDRVIPRTSAQAKGVKRGDQLLDVNGQNFEKISLKEASTILNKNTELSLTLKTNLFGYKEMTLERDNPQRKSRKGPKRQSLRENRSSLSLGSTGDEVFDPAKHKKAPEIKATGTSKSRKLSLAGRLGSVPAYLNTWRSGRALDDSFLTVPNNKLKSSTGDFARSSFRRSANLSHSDPDLLEPSTIDFFQQQDAPKDIIKVYKADQTFRFLFVNDDTTAIDIVVAACREFGIDGCDNHALYRVSVQSDTLFVKQSKLPDAWSKLADIPLGARYYLKNTMQSDQLLPDENIPDLVKEANFSFLDLNCFEVALYLTREDYRLFQQTEPTNFIDDLFHRDTELQQFKAFEDLVNRELFWVVTTICYENSAVQRAKIIKQFIKIARHCKVLKNFNSTFAIISGLGYRAVSRLKQSWEKVPVKTVRLFEELQALMDPSRNMSKYRTLLNDFIHQPPVIPYIPVVKKDLTFLHLGNDTKVNGLINFEKMRMIAKEVRNVCRLCAPDRTQIISTAIASQTKDQDKSGLYQTLMRRERRASFNNLRRTYEDQMNVRRVKQYMKQLTIISNEEKLMESSKEVEPQGAPSSGQVKRRNTSSALAAPSPARNSKTLPNQSGRVGFKIPSNDMQTRNNSDPQLVNIPDITIQPVRKKTMSSTLPKYASDLQSPQMISRKLMSLSEEAGSERKSRFAKEAKRSASVSSHEFSPSNSPYTTPKHQNLPKMAESNHTVASENVNRNNNRLSLPSGSTNVSGGEPVHLHSGLKKAYPGHGHSTTSSSRSSIASTSSLGTMSSSNPSTPSLVGSGGSPRSSSPVSWGSSTSLTTGAQHALRKNNTNSPSRSGSGSSTDTVKMTGAHLHERPIIKQNRNSRSSSCGGAAMIPSTMNERILSQMSASTSTPSLNANRPQTSLILPNHPRIPRAPSIDSGVVSGCSASVESLRYSHAEDPDLRVHHPHAPSPTRGQGARPADNSSSSSRRGLPVRSTSLEQVSTSRRSPATSHQDEPEKVERTFLSGYRGPWDTPRPDQKDPTNLPYSVVNATADPGKLPPDMLFHPGHVPPGSRPAQSRHGTRSVLGKGAVKNIHDFIICERQAMHNHTVHRSNNPVMQPNYIRAIRTATPEAMLEEQLVLQLQQQKLQVSGSNHAHYLTTERPMTLVDLKRLSLSNSDTTINEGSMWPNYPGTHFKSREQLHSPTAHAPSGENFHRSRPSPSHGLRQHPQSPSGSISHPFYQTLQSMRPAATPNGSHRGLNPTEAMALNAYDALQYHSDWPVEGVESISSTCPNGHEVRTERGAVMVTAEDNDYLQHARKRYSNHHDPVDVYYDQVVANDPIQLQSPYSQHLSAEHLLRADIARHPNLEIHVSHVRRKSEEWNETDLDGNRNAAMKARSSRISLPVTPVSSKLMSTHQHEHLPPQKLQHSLLQKNTFVEIKKTKIPPPPPQRTSSRPQNHSSSGLNPPSSSLSLNQQENSSNRGPDFTSLQANGHVPNGQTRLAGNSPPTSLTSSNDRGLPPSYSEALQHINAKHSLYSPINSTYRSFNETEVRDNAEQISQV